MKTCSKCGASKPRSAFRSRKGSRDGLHGWCDPCYRTYYSARMREWRRKNPERDAANARRFRENNAEAALGRYTRYREQNREKMREYARKRRKENPDLVRESYARWRRAHLAQERDRGYRRRLMHQQASDEVRALVAQLLEEPCAYCGSTEQITIDHIVPLSRGGRHEVENLAPACLPCNCSKGARLLSEWAGR